MKSLDVASFRQMLMLASDSELQQFAASSHPEWVLDNGRVVFAAPVTAKSERVPDDAADQGEPRLRDGAGARSAR